MNMARKPIKESNIFFLLKHDFLSYKDTCKNYFKVSFKGIKSVLISATIVDCKSRIRLARPVSHYQIVVQLISFDANQNCNNDIVCNISSYLVY